MHMTLGDNKRRGHCLVYIWYFYFNLTFYTLHQQEYVSLWEGSVNGRSPHLHSKFHRPIN